MGTVQVTGVVWVPTNIAMRSNGEPDCDVTQRAFSSASPPQPIDTLVPHCDQGRSTVPCWEFGNSTQCTGNTQVLTVCYDAGCDPMAKPMTRTDALISCAINP